MDKFSIGGFLHVLAGNILRLSSGLLVVVLLARTLGTEGFGIFVYGLALASLAVVVLNFGLGTAVLRRFGAEPENNIETLAKALTGKLLLLVPIVVLTITASFLLPIVSFTLFLTLLLAQIAESFSEVYQLAFRATSRFRDEARTASITALLHLTVMGIVASVWPEPLTCAIGFMASRILGLFITAHAAQRAYRHIPLSSSTAAWRFLRNAFAYAIEFAVSTANTQLDSVLIQSQLGMRSVGLYQAGMKLVQGVSRLAPILAMYLLPRLTRRIEGGKLAQALLTLAIFSAIGALAGSILALIAEPVVTMLFGPDYSELSSLLPWFGLLLALRFVETGAGLVLVAANLQSRKVWLVALQLLLLIVGGLWAMTRWGLLGWLWTAICSTIVLLALYLWLWMRHRRFTNTAES